MNVRRLAVLLAPSALAILTCGGDKDSAPCPDWNTDTFYVEYYYWFYRHKKACTGLPESPRDAANQRDYHETNCTEDGARLFFKDEDCLVNTCIEVQQSLAWAAEAGADLACDTALDRLPDECDVAFDAFFRACPPDPAM